MNESKIKLSVTLEEINEQRKLGWPDFHPEEYCHRCGGKNVSSWYVDSDRWRMAFPNGDSEYQGIVCPGCFVELHELHSGLITTWKLVPDDFRDGSWKDEETDCSCCVSEVSDIVNE